MADEAAEQVEATDLLAGIDIKIEIPSPGGESSDEIEEFVQDGGKPVKKRVACVICEKKFGSLTDLKSHIRFHHLRHLFFSCCHVCKVTFEKHKEQRRHIRIFHKRIAKGLKCGICSITCYTKVSLNAHLKKVHPTFGRVLMCTICNKQFKSKNSLYSHSRFVHPKKDESVVCICCDKTYKTKKRLQEHIKLVHTSEDDVVSCLLCNVQFKSQKTLTVHNRKFHNTKIKTDIFCPQCNKYIKRYRTYTMETAVANNDTFFCKDCYTERVPKLPPKYKPRIVHIRDRSTIQCTFCLIEMPANHVLVKHKVPVPLVMPNGIPYPNNTQTS